MELSFSFTGSRLTTSVLVFIVFGLTGFAFYSLAGLDNPLLFFASVLLIIGIIFFSIGLSQWRLKRIIENTPTSKIRSIAMGLVEISGTVAKPFTEWLISPFTKQNCAYYSCTIQEHRKQGKTSTWVTIFSRILSVPFYVKDNTGTVLVDARGATIDTQTVYTKQTGLFSSISSLPKPIVQYCNLNNIGIKGILGMQRPLKFTEQILPVNSTVYVLGTAGDNPHVEEATAQQSMQDIMIQHNARNPYFISTKPEKELLSSFTWNVTACLVGGCAGILIGIGVGLMGVGVV